MRVEGSALEAADASVRQSTVLKLEASLADRQEAAWKRVVLDKHSKREIVETCAVAAGTVALMRRVLKRFRTRERNTAWRKFKRDIGVLEECSWSNALLAHRNADKTERTLEMRAQSLAKGLRTRFTDKLSQDPELTARALAIYDPDLPGPLRAALAKTTAVAQEEEDDDEL
jgi:hypothetical protein